MRTTLAFDVYGTLIDTNGVYDLIKKFTGRKALAFMDTWRSKQIEYSFRRGLMRNYVDFSECTRNAMDFSCAQLHCSLSTDEKDKLMQEYILLPLFPEVKESLDKLKSANFRLFAFSNGKGSDLRSLLKNASVLNCFEDIVSVDEIKSFKPDPAVYNHFLQRTKSTKSDSWLISGNPFDVIGSISAGMSSIWVRRTDDNNFDPWGIEPTKIVHRISDLYEVLQT